MDTFLTPPDFIEDHERHQDYVFAPGQGRTPMGIFRDKFSEELAFPNIFCGESRISNDSRLVPVYYSEICRSELRRQDRRVAQDVDNIFFKAKKLQMKNIMDKIQIAIRKRKSGNLPENAGSLSNSDVLQELVYKDVGYKFLKQVRGSPPYFEAVQKDLFAMIRMLGPATLFVTFSAAETRWNHLLKILAEVNWNKQLDDEQIELLNWQEKSELIQCDPVTCARHFDYQVQLLFGVLKSKSSPIGPLKDFFYRVEYQHRGKFSILYVSITYQFISCPATLTYFCVKVLRLPELRLQ